MKIVGVIQARVGSTRLPGKVLLPLLGRPVLERMLERVARATTLDEIVVATTRLATDDSIRMLARSLGVRCVSGHPADLLDRHRDAAVATRADALVKIPSDCPLIDPAVIDQTVGFFRDGHPRFQFVSNLQPPTWPDGNDVEVFTRDLLEEAWREASRPFEREHTTPFMWDQPERFRVACVKWATGRDLSASHRLTLDYVEDYTLISTVFQALHRSEARCFTVEDIVAFLDSHPEVKALNAGRLGSSWMNEHVRDLRTLRDHAPHAEGHSPSLDAGALR
ncbi:MAG TPA: glycosyltransferase family protein [Polyangia bacterium]|nr:glycosyltransferase family protein [Polyangia bacterium]